MKAEDFRIGNLILLTKDDFKTSKVYQLTGFDIYKLDESDCCDIEPIPLDEAWLNKLGFEFVEEASGYCNKNHMMVISKTDDSMIFMPFCTNDDDCYITVNYVHEVQNICFVFGEELTVSM